MQPHPAAPVLMHDLRRFQMQLINGGHHDAVAGGFHLLQGAAHLLVGAFCPGKFHDAGHQRPRPRYPAGLLAEHLIKDLRLQLHAHPHTAGGKVCPCHCRALHGIAFQRRGVRSSGQILHAGHPLCQLHGAAYTCVCSQCPGSSMVTQRGRAKSSSCTGNSYSTRRRISPAWRRPSPRSLPAARCGGSPVPCPQPAAGSPVRSGGCC
mgnify:CR=1 FL=1